MDAEFKARALAFHKTGRPGKIEVVSTKAVGSRDDLALAYSPGVGAACEAIHADPENSYRFTAKGNLVGVISNGTAVLGYGELGPHAAKPVMEGKAILFKRFADIDVFDIEIDETDPALLVETIARIAPTFGGLNLEDIKAPECFQVERALRARLDIPVFHDDQHGTAVVVTAALLNALRLSGRAIGDIVLVCNGAGAAAIACLDMLVAQGVARAHIRVFDSRGMVEQGRPGLGPEKSRYARAGACSLAEALQGADVFLGVSKGNALRAEDILGMNSNPLIMALANPIPEIMPELALRARPDAIVCTGRSDYPNQVNNVLCFPYVFRAALDVRANTIDGAMLSAAAHAIANLAHETSSQCRPGGPALARQLIPDVFDARLLPRVAGAVARAAIESGAARLPLADSAAYVTALAALATRLARPMTPKGAARLHVRDEGEGDVVLLIHGVSNFHGAWAAQVDVLVAQGYRVLAPDLPGHGRSAPLEAKMTVEALAEAMAALLDEKGIASAHVCGISLGGMVAMTLALRYPARVKRLVVADTSACFDSASHKAMLDGWRADFLSAQGPLKRLERAWPMLVSERFRDCAAGERVLAQWKDNAARADGRSYAFVCDGLAEFNIEHELERIASPTLVLAGSEDAMLTPAINQAIAARIEGAVFKTIAGAAHLPNVDSAHQFNDRLLSFLSLR